MTGNAYYNENDAYAAAWLRNLILAGHIPAGDVDERSIADVRADDLRGYAQCHFFAGLGGWPHALRRARWPDDRPIWTGSCPCQPFSVAGKGRGADDPRHLWPHFFRLIRAHRPPVVMGEQVAKSLGRAWFDGVSADLEGDDYACRAVDIPACAVNAPHERSRLYWLAVADAQDADRRPGDGRAQEGAGAEEQRWRRSRRHRDSEPLVDTTRDGRGEGRPEHEFWSGRATVARPSLLVDADEPCAGEERQQRGGQLSGPGGDSPPGPWDNAEWAIGTDGKARRVEPGICLLAHGVSGRLAVRRPALETGTAPQEHWYSRIGALRGLGNAIVPEVAEEVIRAYMETVHHG